MSDHPQLKSEHMHLRLAPASWKLAFLPHMQCPRYLFRNCRDLDQAINENTNFYMILGSRRGGYEELFILGYNTV
jgi:hypothetical protein